MVMVDARKYIIDTGIANGEKVETINSKLRARGFKEYNPLTYIDNWKNLPSSTAEDLKSIGQGLSTFGGEVVKPIHNITADVQTAPKGQKKEALRKAFKDAVNDPNIRKAITGATAGGIVGSQIPLIGTVGGALVGGTGNVVGPENLLNSILSTYNINLNDIKNKNVDVRDIIQGAMTHPVSASLDVMSIPGVGKGTGKLAKSLVREYAPDAIRQMLPDSNLSKFNRSITDAYLNSRVGQAENLKALNRLVSRVDPDRLGIVKNLITNTEEGLRAKDLELANALKSDLRSGERFLINQGILDSKAAKQNAVAQYVMYNIKDRSNLLHRDIVDIIQGKKLSQDTLGRLTDDVSTKTIKELVKRGNKLYDEGKITLLTQKFAPEVDPLGNVIARHEAQDISDIFGNNRIIGRAKEENLAKVLDDSIKSQLELSGRTREGLDVLNELMDNEQFVESLTPDIKADARKAFINKIKQDVRTGNMPDLAKAFEQTALNKYIDKVYFEAIKNSFSHTGNTGPWRQFLNTFKKAVLAQPHWIMLNRFGNFTNNMINGVKIDDYFDAMGKFKKYIPEQLKQQTSFNSYVNAGVEGASKMQNLADSLSSLYQEPFNRIRNAINRFSLSDKTIKDVGRLGSKLYTATSDFTANPFFKTESALELMDRSANYIRQAYREAERTGRNVEDVLKEAKEDNKLFSKLNTEVNKALGDYMGRNYAIPNAYYDWLSELVPFYRFLTQTGRTTLNQLGNRGLALQTNALIPAKVGEEKSKDIIRRYNLAKDYQGGVPYYKYDNMIRTIGYEPIPLGTVAQQLGAGDIMGLLSPQVSTLHDVIDYKNRFGKIPSSPEYLRYKLSHPLDKDNYTPSESEKIRYALNNIFNTTYNPYILANRYAPGVERLLEGKGLQPFYDTNPFTENPEGYVKKYPSELIGRMFGIQTTGNLRDNKRRSKSMAKKEQRYRKKLINKINKNLERKG